MTCSFVTQTSIFVLCILRVEVNAPKCSYTTTNTAVLYLTFIFIFKNRLRIDCTHIIVNANGNASTYDVHTILLPLFPLPHRPFPVSTFNKFASATYFYMPERTAVLLSQIP